MRSDCGVVGGAWKLRGGGCYLLLFRYLLFIVLFFTAFDIIVITIIIMILLQYNYCRVVPCVIFHLNHVTVQLAWEQLAMFFGRVCVGSGVFVLLADGYQRR